MSNYPKARWSVGDAKVGASVWTREVLEGSGGGYYLYTWKRDTALITVEELVQAATRKERQWPINKRSVYATVGEIPVSDSVQQKDRQSQEIEVARMMYADMRKRFGEISEWIEYGNDGKLVWFHKGVTSL